MSEALLINCRVDWRVEDKINVGLPTWFAKSEVRECQEIGYGEWILRMVAVPPFWNNDRETIWLPIWRVCCQVDVYTKAEPFKNRLDAAWLRTHHGKGLLGDKQWGTNQSVRLDVIREPMSPTASRMSFLSRTIHVCYGKGSNSEILSRRSHIDSRLTKQVLRLPYTDCDMHVLLDIVLITNICNIF